MATTWLRDGELCIYTRGDSKNYYMGYRLETGERKQESTKTRNKALAKARASKRFDAVKSRENHGLTQNTVSFAEAADAWLDDIRKQVLASVRKERNIVDYAPIVERYLKPFFEGKDIDRITNPDIAKYKIWRRDYWISGPGASVKEIRYFRGGIEVTRPVSARDRKAPAPRTINGQNVVLRGIFQHAVTEGWMLEAQVPKVKNAKQTRGDSRERAYRHFDIAEYYKLKRFMTLWVTANKISEKERVRREAVQDYILILLNSGLREHELFKKDPRSGKWRGIRWCDVERFKSAGNVETVELQVDGKTKKRSVVCQRPVRAILDRRRTFRCPDHKDTDFVMALPDGSLPSRYDSGVRRLLKSAGLLIDPKTGRNRGIYSARHSYATWRIQAGASTAIVADNMGTSEKMLDHHYYHHQSRVTADSLMQGKAGGVKGDLSN